MFGRIVKEQQLFQNTSNAESFAPVRMQEGILNTLLPLHSCTDLLPLGLSKSKHFLFNCDLFGQKLIFFPEYIRKNH